MAALQHHGGAVSPSYGEHGVLVIAITDAIVLLQQNRTFFSGITADDTNFGSIVDSTGGVCNTHKHGVKLNLMQNGTSIQNLSGDQPAV